MPTVLQVKGCCLLGRADFVNEVGNEFNYEPDPKDDMYVNLALDGRATYLISRDNDLLELMKETEAGKDFRGRFPGLTILNAVAFLRAIEKRASSFATISDPA